MTRSQAINNIKELKNKFVKAFEDEEYHLDIDIDEDTYDLINSLCFAMADMKAFQEILNVTIGVVTE